jgi:AraC-like DNA-binding protein
MDSPYEVERHDSEIGSWESVRTLPDPRLRSHVYSYVGYFTRTPGETVRRHLPGLRVPLIFMFEPRFEVIASEQLDASVVVRHAFVAGLHDSFAVTRSPGHEAGLQVDFTALAARAILGLPMHLLSGRALEAEEVLGSGVRLLSEQLRDAPGWPARFEAVDRFLLRRMAAFESSDPGVEWAYRRIVKSGGRSPIAGLAGSLGWDHRRLVDGFRDGVGLTPKTLARVVRFNRAVRMAERDTARSWAEISAAAGYYDQPHLVREFVSLSGCTPTALVARFLPGGGGVDG